MDWLFMIQHFHCGGTGKAQDTPKRRGRKTPQHGIGWHNPDHLAILSTRLRHSSLWKKKSSKEIISGSTMSSQTEHGKHPGQARPRGRSRRQGSFLHSPMGEPDKLSFSFSQSTEEPECHHDRRRGSKLCLTEVFLAVLLFPQHGYENPVSLLDLTS